MACEKEIWQKIGEGFVQAYYNQFDNTNRMELGNLYVSLLSVHLIISCFDEHEHVVSTLTNQIPSHSTSTVEVTVINALMHGRKNDCVHEQTFFCQSPDACLTWEGSPFQGREAIAGKLAVSVSSYSICINRNPQNNFEKADFHNRLVVRKKNRAKPFNDSFQSERLLLCVCYCSLN